MVNGLFAKRKVRTCCPLSFGNVGAPFLPVFGSLAILLETPLLLGEVFVTVKDNHGGPRSGQRAVKHVTSIGWRGEKIEAQQEKNGNSSLQRRRK